MTLSGRVGINPLNYPVNAPLEDSLRRYNSSIPLLSDNRLDLLGGLDVFADRLMDIVQCFGLCLQ